jgi:hypothetical protein
MPTEIRLWRVENERPQSIPQQKLDLEGRIENWIRDDIELINGDFLIIGQQVPTAYGGFIDLLAIDRVGNLVILELKRDKTPRDVVAQVLDYASWVQNLGHDEIQSIANAFLKSETLEDAFRNRFQTDLPDVLNERHRMYVVASSLDSATERIVKYLAESHSVDINVATFGYFKTSVGEFLGRSLLLDDEQVQVRAETTSKRQPPRTSEELRELARERGVLDLYDKALAALRPLFDGMNRTRTNIALVGYTGENKARNVIIGIYPGESSSSNGLAMTLSVDRMSEYFKLSSDKLCSVLDSPAKNTKTYDPNQTFFLDLQHLKDLISLLSEVKQRR